MATLLTAFLYPGFTDLSLFWCVGFGVLPARIGVLHLLRAKSLHQRQRLFGSSRLPHYVRFVGAVVWNLSALGLLGLLLGL
eukprot:6388513-Amphidinium_carterae.1